MISVKLFILHIFDNHLLPKVNLEPQLKNTFELIWPSIFLLICFALIVFIKTTSFVKVVKIIQSTFNVQNWHQLQREDYNPYKFYSIILAALFAFNVSFLLYKLNTVYNLIFTQAPHLIQFLIIFGILTALIFLKIIVNKILMVFTGSKNTIHQYGYYSFIINQTFGLFIFPFIVLAEFSKFNSLIFLTIALAIIGLSVLLKWFRGIVFSLVEERIGLLQTFAYLCTLEILPVLVLVKFIVETF